MIFMILPTKTILIFLVVYLDDMNLNLDLDLSLCLDNLKELDLDLAQIHLGFQGSKSMDLKYPPKPKNLEIPRPALTLVLSSSAILCHAPSAKLFFLLFLTARFVSLYTFPPLYPLYLSLSTKSES